MKSIVVDRLRDVFGDKPAYEILSASELEIAHACMTARRARSEVESTIDAANLDRCDIIAWLKTLPIGWDESVVVFWRSFRCGVQMAFKDFALHFDDLWYPASDDVWVSSNAHDWLLDLGHEETFVFRGEDPHAGKH
jgi:hypothetical protein